ncbi:hypothetical protein HME9302_00923 [Alteripontixanthobacter maritimus]|uniref:Elongation factor P n=1 Tax=Alteripontixanthobacter maritimus TaxID=2161824 RepID=A0A369Q9Z3_9SPHN|nr:elongation factor P [Alteripontixanthobacter maritimus]RDC59729.1 hypothetical protein HME9302_00923 [Alteripontixanthobacter maritimus]
MKFVRTLCATLSLTAVALFAGLPQGAGANSAEGGQGEKPGGRLGLLKTGQYRCALPGDAAGPAIREMPEMNFTIDNASTYHDVSGSGTYLLIGNVVTFTRGPMKGVRFARYTANTLRKLDDNGEKTRLLCKRAGPAKRP